jgi:hypothetical protein
MGKRTVKIVVPEPPFSNPEEIKRKLENIRPGDRIIYHKGFTVAETEMGALAWQLHEKGKARLMRRRSPHNPSTFDFYALGK